MKSKIHSVLKQALEDVKPNEEELRIIKSLTQGFLKILEASKKKLKIDAEIFVGGSAAKGTIIKKDHYDIDIFLRFHKKYPDENLSDLTERILKVIPKKQKIHGSRDYFRVKTGKTIFFEIIPVKRIKNQKEAENVTDLSYFHVNYVKRKLKGKLLDEVRLAKAFCHANGCYGAESYIKGFSGYALELLIYNYGSFLKFIRAMEVIGQKAKPLATSSKRGQNTATAKVKKGQGKIVIDIEKNYKNKNTILMDLNSAKLQSPIIVIDPTHKQRNVLAALSDETFEKFQKACMDFLKNPSIKAFENKGVNFEEIEKNAKKKKYEFILLEAITDRQEGDIAGSKLLKFYNHLAEEINKYFDVKKQEFEYNGEKTARFAFAVKKKKEILLRGPKADDKENLKRFKAKHKKIFIKNNRIYAKGATNMNLNAFIKNWEKKNGKRLKEMYVVNLTIAKLKF